MAAKGKEEKAKSLPEGESEGVSKKPSKLKRIVIILAILLILLGGAAGAYWWFFIRAPAMQQASDESPAEVTEADAASSTEKKADKKTEEAGKKQDAEKAAGGDVARVERQTTLPRSGGQVLPLPPVTVNIADPSGRRYLKLGMEVEVNTDVGKALENNNARIRDAIIMLLAGRTVADLTSPDGKIMLKAEVAARLNQILGAQRVVRVYFTDFVVQ